MPAQVSCLDPGLRWVMVTSTAWSFAHLGGMEHTLKLTSSPSTGTYSPSISEMCTKTSLPPSEGVMKPCPLEREKHLHTPVNTGPSAARAVAEKVLLRLVGSGLGMVKPLIGEGERSLCREEGRCRDPGDAGETGDLGELGGSSGGVKGRLPSMGVASEDMLEQGEEMFS